MSLIDVPCCFQRSCAKLLLESKDLITILHEVSYGGLKGIKQRLYQSLSNGCTSSLGIIIILAVVFGSNLVRGRKDRAHQKWNISVFAALGCILCINQSVSRYSNRVGRTNLCKSCTKTTMIAGNIPRLYGCTAACASGRLAVHARPQAVMTGSQRAVGARWSPAGRLE